MKPGVQAPDRLDELAHEAVEGRATTYRQFPAILAELTSLGFTLLAAALVSAVARSYVERKGRILHRRRLIRARF
jgi:hypothetical protein